MALLKMENGCHDSVHRRAIIDLIIGTSVERMSLPRSLHDFVKAALELGSDRFGRAIMSEVENDWQRTPPSMVTPYLEIDAALLKASAAHERDCALYEEDKCPSFHEWLLKGAAA